MTTIQAQDIERDPSSFLRKVRHGESFVIVEADLPIAQLKPVVRAAQRLRPAGLCAGEFTTPEDFDDPLPEEILRDFEGS